MLTLEQILALPAGHTPTLPVMRDLVQYIINNRDAIAVIDPSPPIWQAPGDTRGVLVETGGVADVYTATWADASGNNLFEGLRVILHGVAATNTGACTLNIGSLEGAVAIKKQTPAGAVNPEAGDMPLAGCELYYSAAESAWLMTDPVHVSQIVTTTLGDVADYNEGDFIYVVD